MESNVISKIIILISLGILFALLPIITVNLNFITGNSNKREEYNDDINLDNKNLKISTVSGKIHIDNNWTAAEAAGICTGYGTYFEPYVIEDLVIDGESSGSCILIENSDVYFIIENCTVYSSGGSPDVPDAGITLSNANNGYLINNNCSNNYSGICLDYSNNNIISGNTANNNYWNGICIFGSNNNNISGNNANNNSWGICIRCSDYNDISGNNANNNSRGIYMGCSDYNDISGNTANYNSWGMYISNSHGGNDILGNNANYNSYGIFLLNSDYNDISGNTANNNYKSGIELAISDGNDILGNIANYNSYGIFLSSSDCNNISGNILIGNDLCIVEYYCSGNKFSDNGSCTYGQGDGIPLIILISVIIAGAVIGVATLLLIIRKRKRIE